MDFTPLIKDNKRHDRGAFERNGNDGLHGVIRGFRLQEKQQRLHKKNLETVHEGHYHQ